MYHIFVYLKKNLKRKIYLDPDHPKVNESRFQKFDWKDSYKGAKEPIPNSVLEARGRATGLQCFVDADHASDKVTCCHFKK